MGFIWLLFLSLLHITLGMCFPMITGKTWHLFAPPLRVTDEAKRWIFDPLLQQSLGLFDAIRERWKVWGCFLLFLVLWLVFLFVRRLLLPQSPRLLLFSTIATIGLFLRNDLTTRLERLMRLGHGGLLLLFWLARHPQPSNRPLVRKMVPSRRFT